MTDIEIELNGNKMTKSKMVERLTKWGCAHLFKKSDKKETIMGLYNQYVQENRSKVLSEIQEEIADINANGSSQGDNDQDSKSKPSQNSTLISRKRARGNIDIDDEDSQQKNKIVVNGLSNINKVSRQYDDGSTHTDDVLGSNNASTNENKLNENQIKSIKLSTKSYVDNIMNNSNNNNNTAKSISDKNGNHTNDHIETDDIHVDINNPNDSGTKFENDYQTPDFETYNKNKQDTINKIDSENANNNFNFSFGRKDSPLGIVRESDGIVVGHNFSNVVLSPEIKEKIEMAVINPANENTKSQRKISVQKVLKSKIVKPEESNTISPIINLTDNIKVQDQVIINEKVNPSPFTAKISEKFILRQNSGINISKGFIESTIPKEDIKIPTKSQAEEDNLKANNINYKAEDFFKPTYPKKKSMSEIDLYHLKNKNVDNNRDRDDKSVDGRSVDRLFFNKSPSQNYISDPKLINFIRNLNQTNKSNFSRANSCQNIRDFTSDLGSRILRNNIDRVRIPDPSFMRRALDGIKKILEKLNNSGDNALYLLGYLLALASLAALTLAIKKYSESSNDRDLGKIFLEIFNDLSSFFKENSTTFFLGFIFILAFLAFLNILVKPTIPKSASSLQLHTSGEIDFFRDVQPFYLKIKNDLRTSKKIQGLTDIDILGMIQTHFNVGMDQALDFYAKISEMLKNDEDVQCTQPPDAPENYGYHELWRYIEEDD